MASGILRRSTRAVQRRRRGAGRRGARGARSRIAEALGHVGVLTVEFFASRDGPVVNEIAPRVHNSGHWTIEGAVTSQFEQHIRAICGLPPGATDLVGRGAVMDNLIGDEVEPLARAGRRPGRPRPHLRQGRGSPRPQDGPCHAGARASLPAPRGRSWQGGRLLRCDHLDRHAELRRAAAAPWRRRRPRPRRTLTDRCAAAPRRRARPRSAPGSGWRASRNNCRAGDRGRSSCIPPSTASDVSKLPGSSRMRAVDRPLQLLRR